MVGGDMENVDGRDVIVVERWKLEVLKIYYALFTALIDEQHGPERMSDAVLLDKLRQLSALLKTEVSERGSLN
jgi:hypothetical protein